MPRGERVTIGDAYKVLLELQKSIQPLAEAIARQDQKLSDHIAGINPKVDGAHGEFRELFKQQAEQIDNLSKIIEQYQSDRKLAKIAIRASGVVLGSVGAVFYTYRDKLIAVIHAIFR